MGYGLSKGVRDHKVAAAQVEKRRETWHNFKRDVDNIVETHKAYGSDANMLQGELHARYKRYERSQRRLNNDMRRAGSRRTMNSVTPKGLRAGLSTKQISRHAKGSANSFTAMAYAQAAFVETVESPTRGGQGQGFEAEDDFGFASGVHQYDEAADDIPPPPPDGDEPPPPPPGDPAWDAPRVAIGGHSQSMSLARPRGSNEFAGAGRRPHASMHQLGRPRQEGEDEFQRLIMPPLPPRQISATGTSVTVQWVCTEPTALKYELQFRPKARKEWRTISASITDKVYVLRNLPPGRGLYLRVRCLAGSRGWSSWSVTSRVIKPLKLGPMVPGAPILSDVTTDTITVTWAPPSDNGARITLYTLLMGTFVQNEAGAELGEDITMVYSGPDNWFRARSLNPVTKYSFRVIATNAFGDSDVSEPGVAVTKRPEVVAPLRTIGEWSEWWDESEARSYFVNTVTGENSWELPPEFNTLLRRFGEWAEYWDETSQHCFYYNLLTQERSWEPPSFLVEDAGGDDGAAEAEAEAEAAAAGSGSGSGAGYSISMAGGGDDSVTASQRALPIVTVTSVETQADKKFRSQRYQLLWGARKLDTRPGSITISVSRVKVVLDSFTALARFSVPDLQNRLHVQFLGEKGVDSGGLHKDWCLLLSRKCCAPSAAMFVTSSSGFLDINPAFAAHKRAPEAYRLLGRFVSKAMFDRQLVDMPLSTALVMRLLSRQPKLEDLLETDEQLVTGLTWVLGNDIEGVIDSTFSTVVPPAVGDEVLEAVLGEELEADEGEDDDDGGVTPSTPLSTPVAAGAGNPVGFPSGPVEPATVELKPGGDDIEVTNDNKREYIDLMIDFRTGKQFSACLAALRQGIFELLDEKMLSTFTVEQFRAMLNGKPDVDVELMRKTSQYTGGLTAESELSQWFWEIFAACTRDERALVLKFCTGTSRVPLDGFEPLFTLSGFGEGNVDGLPQTHTCFNQLHIPTYTSKEVFKAKLLLAIHESDGFMLE